MSFHAICLQMHREIIAKKRGWNIQYHLDEARWLASVLIGEGC